MGSERRRYVLAFDVGGTSIKGAVLAEDGRVEERTYLQASSRSDGTREDILDRLYWMVKEAANRVEQLPAGKAEILGAGFAFPGPFDYERGVSYIRGLCKFEALYGVNVKEEVTRRMESDHRLAGLLAAPVRVAFGNDAALFASGEAAFGSARRFRRAVCLTLGTGLGSGFVEEGRLIASRNDVPEDGWLFRLPWKDGIVDDYASRRGILRLAASCGFPAGSVDVKDVAAAAQAGDANAALVFERFGEELGEILAAYAAPFRPEAVVFGGRISNSWHLFVPAMRARLAEAGLPIEAAQSPDTLRSTFQGILLALTQ